MARIDTALTYLTAPADSTLKWSALLVKGRAQVDLGDFAGAASTVAAIPTKFQYNFDYSQTTFDNEWWIMGPSVKRYTVGDSVNVAGRILNVIPFAQLNDPRVSVTNTGTKAEDNITTFFQVNNWGRDDPVPPLSGIDARLIEAEAKLQANDIAGMMTILNALRTYRRCRQSRRRRRRRMRRPICSSARKRSGNSSAATAWTICGAWSGSMAARRTRCSRPDRSPETAHRPESSGPRLRSRFLMLKRATRISRVASIRRRNHEGVSTKA
jgi:hypothetical protein